MSIFTVHEPPLRARDSVPDPERFVFVRDGFYFWAFALTPLWMIWHRMWLVLLIYLIVTVGADSALHYAGIGSGSVVVVELLISFLVGFEAARCGVSRWRGAAGKMSALSAATMSTPPSGDFSTPGPGRQRKRSSRRRISGPAAAPPPSAAHAATPGIVGLFPEPGAPR